jgi:hypothetical protein
VKRKGYYEDAQIKPDWIVESISEAGEIIIQVLTEGRKA